MSCPDYNTSKVFCTPIKDSWISQSSMNRLLPFQCWQGNCPRVSMEFCGMVLHFCSYFYYFFFSLSTTYYLHTYLLYFIVLTFSSNWDILLIIYIFCIYVVVLWTHLRSCYHTKCNLRCVTYCFCHIFLYLNIPVAWLLTGCCHTRFNLSLITYRCYVPLGFHLTFIQHTCRLHTNTFNNPKFIFYE